ncbi:MAG: hypothetical protein AAB074_07405 [Planctomycetota bacterium]
MSKLNSRMGNLNEAILLCEAIAPESLPPVEREELQDHRALLRALETREKSRQSSTFTTALFVMVGLLMICVVVSHRIRTPGSSNAAIWFFLVLFGLYLLPKSWRLARWLYRKLFPNPRSSPTLLAIFALLRSDRRFDLAIAIGETRLASHPEDDALRQALAEVRAEKVAPPTPPDAGHSPLAN